jgi:hypothetical protein
LKELFGTIYAENIIEKMMSGHSYERAVRAHTLTHLALAQEVVKTISLTEDEVSALEAVLSNNDKSTILKAHEDERFKAIQTKFNDTIQSLENRGPTAKL